MTFNDPEPVPFAKAVYIDEPTVVLAVDDSPSVSTCTTTYSRSSDLELALMRHRRKRRTLLGGLLGGTLGLFVMGPFGAVVGGVAGALWTKSSLKEQERVFRQNPGRRCPRVPSYRVDIQ